MEVFGKIMTILLIVLCLSFIGAGIALWLWNAVAIPAFGAPALGYWQMYGLIWLLRFIVPTSISTGSKD